MVERTGLSRTAAERTGFEPSVPLFDSFETSFATPWRVNMAVARRGRIANLKKIGRYYAK
jgi:hypothetical protein